MNRIEAAIVEEVVADSKSRLSRALTRRDYISAENAMRTIVEAALPVPRVNIERVVDGQYRKTPGPHVAWKWVTATGTTVLLTHAPVQEWGKIEVSSFITYPGLSKRTSLLYHDGTWDAAVVPMLVKRAVKAMGSNP